MDIQDILVKVAIMFVPFLFSLCFHEYAHALVAKWRGDNTAQLMGRLTLNPADHADLVGTYILPLAVIITGAPLFFGWAKPVPVNGRNLKNYKTDMFWIASAGPISNIFLALLGAFVLAFMFRFGMEMKNASLLFTGIKFFIQINLLLAFFNLIPLHPLDGAKVLARFLPNSVNRFLEENQQYSGFILLFLFLSGALSFLHGPMDFVMKKFTQFAFMII